MPQALPLVFAAISAATAVGGTVYSAVNQPDPNDALKQQESMMQKEKLDAEQTRQREALQAARRAAPDLQAQLGGAVSPDYYAQVLSTLTGYGDQLGAGSQAANGLFGGGKGLDLSGLSSGLLPPGGLNPASGTGGVNPLQNALAQFGFSGSGGGGSFNGGVNG